MPRRKEAPGRGTSRRSRRGGDERKPIALMDIVVGAVRRLGALMGVSVTDIERCAVAEGDLPARAGARSILRLGLNRAVETGRLQRLPGGLFRLPDDSEKGEVEGMEVDAAERREGAGEEGEGERLGREDEEGQQLLLMPSEVPSRDQLPLQLRPFDQLPPEQLTTSRCEKRRRVRTPGGARGGGGGGGGVGGGVGGLGERSAAEHGRAACAALFKLSADVISVIAQTAAARLSGVAGEDVRHAESNVAADADPARDADDADADAHDAPRKRKKVGSDSSSDLLADTHQVVGATGAALSEIAVAATKGASRVLQVSSDAEEGMSGGGARGGAGATKEAIFRTFKEAAMDIVRAARAFGEALGGATEEAVVDDDARLRRDDRDDDNDADAGGARSRDADADGAGPPTKDRDKGGGGGAETCPDGDGARDALYLCDDFVDDDGDDDDDDDVQAHLLIANDGDPVCVDAAPSPDMEDFLRNLLQDVRELTQRVGNRIN